MALVDAEGRLFGRWNFIDAVVALLILGLIPIGYAAYALFRTPAPMITAIEPRELVEGPDQRVTITGVNLRPYLRVSFNSTQGKTFLFEDSTAAAVDLHQMPPGTYDVILYDFGQERHRLPNALTIKPAAPTLPAPDVVVAGRFINLTQALAAQLKPGAAVLAGGQLLETAPPRSSVARVFAAGATLELPSAAHWEVPAIVKLQCVMRVTQGYPECGGVEFSLRPNYIFQSTVAGGAAPFQVDQIYSTAPVNTMHANVRFTGAAEALKAMKVGDLDVELARNPFALGAQVTSLGPASATAGQSERSGVLAFRAQRLPSGWWYGIDTVRVSGQVAFKTDRYTVTAIVTSLENE